MKTGDKVFVLWNNEKLRATFIVDFWENEANEYFATLRLDSSLDIGYHGFISYVTVPLTQLRKYEADGVKLNFPEVRWTYNGLSEVFSISETHARGFVAMAKIDKILAIKSFRAQYRTPDDHPTGLKTAKDVIEAFMNRFPR